MSIILGIDTASFSTHAALVRDEQTLALASAEHSKSAEALSELIDQVLGLARLGFDALDGVAVTSGPGSFTGLRTGLATAQGIGFACKIPVLGVSSFAARVVSQEPGEEQRVAVQPCAPGEYFTLRYRVPQKARVEICSEIEVLKSEELPENCFNIAYPGELYGSKERNPALDTARAWSLDFLGDESHYKRYEAGFGIELLYIKPVAAKTIAERLAQSSS